MLDKLAPSPLNTLNRAIALAQIEGPKRALEILAELRPPAWLFTHYLWDGALGELWRQAGDADKARDHFQRAQRSAPTDAERALLQRRLDLLG
jgi:predicted RNA polymerase sigma factor